ncbi:MAG TPA: metallophosphoesterase [Gammaproteobacteria bacterium]|nr:metallophosphoesterase [Gammaproteobacteria bacterium]
MTDKIPSLLENRLGRTHARRRLGIESDKDQHIFGLGLNFFHPENWYSLSTILRYTLKMTGLYYLGQRNSQHHTLSNNLLSINNLPAEFEGYKILHLSDLHVDMNRQAMINMNNTVTGLEYDICVMTGDYRAKTFGSIAESIEGMRSVVDSIKKPVYAVLGNHDSIRMVPALESMGIRILLNETVTIKSGQSHFYISGVDDAHYFRVDNIDKTSSDIPNGAPSILLSHTPEIYKQAAHAGYGAFLCGHTHGGQICLPGKIPVTLDSKCPRYMGSGSWKYKNMTGYTSVGAGTSIVDVRINCPPEITIHKLTGRMHGPNRDAS